MIDELVGPGSLLRRTLGPSLRRLEAAVNRLVHPWLVVLAVGRDTAAVRRTTMEVIPRGHRVMWVTDAAELGRDWPNTWVVHRVDPRLGPTGVDAVRAWTAGTMRVRRIVVLDQLPDPGLVTAQDLGV